MIGDARAVEPLIAAFTDESEVQHVRKAAVDALGEIGDGRAVEPLLAALQDGVSWQRNAACEALGRIGDARAVGPLIDALKDYWTGARPRQRRWLRYTDPGSWGRRSGLCCWPNAATLSRPTPTSSPTDPTRTLASASTSRSEAAATPQWAPTGCGRCISPSWMSRPSWSGTPQCSTILPPRSGRRPSRRSRTTCQWAGSP